jgi:hypothetical protein
MEEHKAHDCVATFINLFDLQARGYTLIDRPPEYALEIKTIEKSSGHRMVTYVERNANVYGLDANEDWYCLNPPEVQLPF